MVGHRGGRITIGCPCMNCIGGKNERSYIFSVALRLLFHRGTPMPNPKINWVNDHTHICDRLDTRVQLMEDYINGKSDDFDGSTVKRSLLGQAREQITWYRQSIDALDFVGAVACRRALESGQPFLEHYLLTYNFRETERGTEYKRDTDFPILPAMWSRPSDDDDERFPDVSETPDGGLPDLR